MVISVPMHLQDLTLGIHALLAIGKIHAYS